MWYVWIAVVGLGLVLAGWFVFFSRHGNTYRHGKNEHLKKIQAYFEAHPSATEAFYDDLFGSFVDVPNRNLLMLVLDRTHAENIGGIELVRRCDTFSQEMGGDSSLQVSSYVAATIDQEVGRILFKISKRATP